MIYGDLLNGIYSLNTGNTPDNVSFVTKLVTGKVARRRLPDLSKLATIPTAGLTTLDLRVLLPDFLDFKLDPRNNNVVVYSLNSDGIPTFYTLCTPTEFAINTQGRFIKREGRTLTFSVAAGESIPDTIYFPYYSFFCWEDAVTSLPKESPENNDDILLLTSAFDDVIIEGILLYISRREKENSEFTKNVQEWEKRVNEIIYYS